MLNYHEEINITDEDREREESHSYHLYSLIVHEGYSTAQGHYYAFIKHAETNLWYRYDDDVVKLIGPTLQSVKRQTQQSYMLFYQKKYNIKNNKSQRNSNGAEFSKRNASRSPTFYHQLRYGLAQKQCTSQSHLDLLKQFSYKK